MGSSGFDGSVQVTFLLASGQLEIKMMSYNTSIICGAAHTLRAWGFVMIDGLTILDDAPKWALFEMRYAEKDNPIPGLWSIRDPKRQFPTQDAAVMYAIAKGAG